MICYRLKDKIFFNPYTAFLHAAHNCPHEHVYFDVHDQVFDCQDWTNYPTESYRDMYKRRAQQIRNKYEKIVLAFSGGTDSTTMLSAFFDNNIHVDTIYIGHHNKSKHYADSYVGDVDELVLWIKQQWPEQAKNTDIELIDLSKFIDSRYNNTDWILDQHRTFHMRFTPGICPEEVSELYNNKYGAFRWTLLTGHEKPNVSVTDTSVSYVDKTFSHVMNRSNAEFFYLTPDMPEIIIKHAHDISAFQKKNQTGYYQLKHAIGIGRDVAGVNSKAEKDTMKNVDLSLSYLNFSSVAKSIETIRPDNDNCTLALIGGYSQWKEFTVKHWAQGIASLQTDSTLIKYMVNHGYLTSNTDHVQSYHGIVSKRHYLAKVL